MDCISTTVLPSFFEPLALEPMDLSLVPVEKLIEEIERRSSCFVCAFEMDVPDESGQEIKTVYGKGKWSVACGLSAILHNDCVNNWNGELRTLQKINGDNDASSSTTES